MSTARVLWYSERGRGVFRVLWCNMLNLGVCTAPLAARSELVSKEVLHELSVETPLHRRLRAMKDVGDKVIQGRVEDVSS